MGERSNCCPKCPGCGHHHRSGRGSMDEKSECETVAKKMRELAMELERDGYPAAAITDGMLMVALDAAHQIAGPRHLSNFLGDCRDFGGVELSRGWRVGCFIGW